MGPDIELAKKYGLNNWYDIYSYGKENSSKIRDRWPTNFSKRDKSQDTFTVKVNGKKVK